jgi:hypothetical protein
MPVHGRRRTRAGRPRARRTPFEGGAGPRARQEPARGKCSPSSGTEPTRGGAYPRARRSLLEGFFEKAALVGRWGPPRRGSCPAWLGEVCLASLHVLSGDSPVV